jgi:hypothetical protein
MTQFPKVLTYYVYGTVRNLLAGAGLCYAVQNKRYAEIPLTLFVPSVYAGYHVYKNKEAGIQWMKEMSSPPLTVAIETTIMGE